MSFFPKIKKNLQYKDIDIQELFDISTVFDIWNFYEAAKPEKANIFIKKKKEYFLSSL